MNNVLTMDSIEKTFDFKHLKVGDQAPDFKTTDQSGASVSLSDFQGQKVAIYFYPKDNTPTCTKQACNLRDNYEALQAQDITILGVSPDGQKSHTNFINKFNLPFTLLVDKDKAIAKAFGIFGLKKFMGRESMSIHRTTFLIDEAGRIHSIIEKVVSKDHTTQILEAFGVK